MKELLFILQVLFFSLTVYAQQTGNGKVKIYLKTISCIKESADDIFDFDGKGNEVFVTFFYSVASSNGTTRYVNKITSAVYGDVNGRPARYKDGTAGNNGGIKAGDVVYANPNTEAMMPIGDERFKGQFMFEADLSPTDIITVVPVLWEWDNDTKNTQNSFESFLFNSFNSINVHTAPIAQKFNPVSWPFFYSDGTNCIDLAGMSRILQGVNGIPGNRPIGMALNGRYNPSMFVLNQNILKNWKSVTGLYEENIRFYLNESHLGNTRDHGNYDLMIHVDYMAPPAPAAPPKWSVTAPTKTIIMAPPVKANNFPRILTFVSGTWSGTQTNDQGLYPEGFSFQLTNTGEFIRADQSGVVCCKGSYSIVGSNFSGSFKQFSDGSTYSFIGTYDRNTQIISCSMGSDTATTGQGKWTVTKQ
ncbi:MAG: hypothetical protein ACYC01_08070 [Lutibacter sp.]